MTLDARPDPIDRIAPRRRPDRRAVMYQEWRHLLFVHWEVPAGPLQALLPPGLDLDTYDGRAFVGLVPFTMRGVRPRRLPGDPCLSNFHETNVRTYVHRDGRDPGVWFFSLDAANPAAVALARAWFGLPYYHARMCVEVDDREAARARPDLRLGAGRLGARRRLSEVRRRVVGPPSSPPSRGRSKNFWSSDTSSIRPTEAGSGAARSTTRPTPSGGRTGHPRRDPARRLGHPPARRRAARPLRGGRPGRGLRADAGLTPRRVKIRCKPLILRGPGALPSPAASRIDVRGPADTSRKKELCGYCHCRRIPHVTAITKRRRDAPGPPDGTVPDRPPSGPAGDRGKRVAKKSWATRKKGLQSRRSSPILATHRG